MHFHLLAHSGGQATKTGSTGEGSHHPASSLCGCWVLLFELSCLLRQSVNWQFESILFCVLQSDSM